MNPLKTMLKAKRTSNKCIERNSKPNIDRLHECPGSDIEIIKAAGAGSETDKDIDHGYKILFSNSMINLFIMLYDISAIMASINIAMNVRQ